MTTAKAKTMKESLHEEFSKVFQLCDFILTASQKPSLIKVRTDNPPLSALVSTLTCPPPPLLSAPTHR